MMVVCWILVFFIVFWVVGDCVFFVENKEIKKVVNKSIVWCFLYVGVIVLSGKFFIVK